MLGSWSVERTPAEPQEAHTFFYRGRPVDAGQIGDFEVLVPFTHDAERAAGEAFRTTAELLDWVFPFGYGPLSSWGMDRRVSSVLVA